MLSVFGRHGCISTRRRKLNFERNNYQSPLQPQKAETPTHAAHTVLVVAELKSNLLHWVCVSIGLDYWNGGLLDWAFSCAEVVLVKFHRLCTFMVTSIHACAVNWDPYVHSWLLPYMHVQLTGTPMYIHGYFHTCMCS